MTRRGDRLAVVMATFNGERWLPEQLASIAAQTRRPDLLLVSDDGSTDATVEIMREFAVSAPFPTKLVAGPQKGVGDNFWTAVNGLADFDVLAWSDQDDVWHPEKLERCEAVLARHDCLFVSHSAQVVDETLRSLRGHRCPNYRTDMLRSSLQGDPWHVPSGFASVFRQELLEGIDWDRRPQSHMTARQIIHDHAISLRAFASGRRFHIKESLASYRQHASNVHGDPTPHGWRPLLSAMTVGAQQFVRLASRARGYGDYVSGLPGVDPRAADYFEATARRCERRAAVYEARRVRARSRSLTGAAREGVYAARARGGFGSLALAKDAVDIAVEAVR